MLNLVLRQDQAELSQHEFLHVALLRAGPDVLKKMGYDHAKGDTYQQHVDFQLSARLHVLNCVQSEIREYLEQIYELRMSLDPSKLLEREMKINDFFVGAPRVFKIPKVDPALGWTQLEKER